MNLPNGLNPYGVIPRPGYLPPDLFRLFKQIKDVFCIDPLPVRGFDKAKTFVLLSVLLY